MHYPLLKKILQKQTGKVPCQKKLKNRDRILYVRGLFTPPHEHETLNNNQQKQRDHWQTLMSLGVLTVFACLMLLISIVGDYGLKSTYKLKQRELTLERNLTHLKNSELLMREEIDALKYSLPYIEAVARRELGLVKKNEIVYLLTTPAYP